MSQIIAYALVNVIEMQNGLKQPRTPGVSAVDYVSISLCKTHILSSNKSHYVQRLGCRSKYSNQQNRFSNSVDWSVIILGIPVFK